MRQDVVLGKQGTEPSIPPLRRCPFLGVCPSGVRLRRRGAHGRHTHTTLLARNYDGRTPRRSLLRSARPRFLGSLVRGGLVRLPAAPLAAALRAALRSAAAGGRSTAAAVTAAGGDQGAGRAPLAALAVLEPPICKPRTCRGPRPIHPIIRGPRLQAVMPGTMVLSAGQLHDPAVVHRGGWGVPGWTLHLRSG